jgi:hypothetical protein
MAPGESTPKFRLAGAQQEYPFICSGKIIDPGQVIKI